LPLRPMNKLCPLATAVVRLFPHVTHVFCPDLGMVNMLKFIHRLFRGREGPDDVDKHPEPDMAAHLPYLDAVADALEAAGLNAGRAEDPSDEWRSGFINIAAGPDGDPDDDSENHFVLCWDWRHGWFSDWDSQDGIRWIRYYTGPVTAGPEPHPAGSYACPDCDPPAEAA
jgi:hypothetical protein